MLLTLFFLLFINVCLAIKNVTTESVDANGAHHRHTELIDDGPNGKTLTTYVDQTTNAKTFRGPGFGGASWTIRVVLGSDEVLKLSSAIQPDKVTQGSIAWGPLIKGANLATYTIQQDGKLSGKVDDRVFNSVGDLAQERPDNRLVFADGRPPPVLQAPPELNLTLTKLHSSLAEALKPSIIHTLDVPHLSPILTRPLQPRDAEPANSSMVLLSRGLDRAHDPGHHSWTYDTGSCDSCKVLAMVGIVAAEVVCVRAHSTAHGSSCTRRSTSY